MGSLNKIFNMLKFAFVSVVLPWLLVSQRLRLMPICMEPTATALTPMEDTPMVPTLTPMELTTERGLLMPSPRLMLMPTCMDPMVLTATVPTPLEDTPMVPTLTPMELTAMVPTPMEDTPMVPTLMPTELTTERGPLMLSPKLMLMPTCMVLMAMVPTLTPMEDMPMVPTLMPMGSMESKSACPLIGLEATNKAVQTEAQIKLWKIILFSTQNYKITKFHFMKINYIY